jgi:hypothetical protein
MQRFTALKMFAFLNCYLKWADFKPRLLFKSIWIFNRGRQNNAQLNLFWRSELKKRDSKKLHRGTWREKNLIPSYLDVNPNSGTKKKEIQELKNRWILSTLTKVHLKRSNWWSSCLLRSEWFLKINEIRSPERYDATEWWIKKINCNIFITFIFFNCG